MARGSKPVKVEGPRRTVWKMTVDVGVDPATGKRKQKKLTAPSKRELEEMAARVLADVSRGTYFEPEKMTVAEYLRYWLTNYCEPNLRPYTLKDIRMIINLHFIPAFGNIPLAKLTPAHIQKYYSEALVSGKRDKRRTPRGLSPNTVNKHHRILKESLKHAVEWEIIQRSPADKVKPPKKIKREAQAVDGPAVLKMLESLKGTYVYIGAFIAACTWLREGEVLGMRWKDVDFKANVLRVRQVLQVVNGNLVTGPPKTATSQREVPLLPQLAAALRAHKREQKKNKLALGEVYQDTGYISTWEDGTPINPNTFATRFRTLSRRAGLPLHFHQLRHTAASLMLEAGVPLKNVSQLLGHATVSITGDVYGHVSPAGQREAINKLGEALFGK